MSEPIYREYAPKRFRAESLELLGKINGVIEQYEAQGYSLTVRQIYYQMVARGHVGNNRDSYSKIQSLISDGRLAGLVSWTAVEDRGRELKGVSTYDSPASVLRSARASYRTDLWRGQRFRPEVWIEKQALEGVVERICVALRVDFYACKGYDSQSQSWRAGRRFASRVAKGQQPIVLHLGDHDPSGLDMTRDNQERLSLFAGFQVPVVRLALNMEQIVRHVLPENPDNRPKAGDSRSAAYVEEHGDMGWELDALEPRVIQDLIEREVLALRDDSLWSVALAEEVEELRQLDDLISTFGG